MASSMGPTTTAGGGDTSMTTGRSGVSSSNYTTDPASKKKVERVEDEELGEPQGWKARMKARVFKTVRQLNKAADERHRKRLAEKKEALRLLRRRVEDFDTVTFWKRVTEPELQSWSLRELRIACATRDLRQEGPKALLIQRLMREVWKDKKAEERMRIMKALQDQREAEAAGTVYCFGVGYGELKQSPERPWVRKNLTVMQALSGKGVISISCGFDASIAFAVTEVGDVWSWGEVRPDEMSPLGYYRGIEFTGEAERNNVYATDYAFRKPKLDGTGMIGKEPRPVQSQRFRPRRPMERLEKIEDGPPGGSSGSAVGGGTARSGGGSTARSGSVRSASTRRGGSGTGSGSDAYDAVLADMRDPFFVPPAVLTELRGEDIISVAAGRTHCLALTDGGDVFSWGMPDSGMLGLGAEPKFQEVPRLVDFDFFKSAHQVAVGTSHSIAMTTQGELLVWGLSKNGRLGLGSIMKIGPQPAVASKRFAFDRTKAAECVSLPTPLLSLFNDRRFVKEVACGASHTMALTPEGVWTWGTGDGGRLGHGDTDDRFKPSLIKAFKRESVVSIGAGAWHSAAIVQQPPQRKGGWLYTWGAGYTGQLGQGGRAVSPEPALVESFLDKDIVVVAISCAAFHNAAISSDGDIYTWGLNAGDCLGRPQGLRHEKGDFFPEPGRVEGLREYGVGAVLSVACGNRFTCVVTQPYKVLPKYRIREMARLDLAREEQSQGLYTNAHASAAADVAHLEEEDRKKAVNQLNVSRPLCAQCSTCDGFTPSLFKPMICDNCGHDRKSHTRMRVLGNPQYDAEIAAMRSMGGGAGP